MPKKYDLDTIEPISDPELIEVEEKVLLTRRAFNKTLMGVALTLPLLGMGVHKCVPEYQEWRRLSEFQELLEDKYGYQYDRATKNYFNPENGAWHMVQTLEKKENKLVVVRNAEGKPMVDINRRLVKLRPMAAKALHAADQMMFAKEKKHIIVRQHWRHNLDQLALFKDPDIYASPPGKSFHEAGLAIDVVNWKEAQSYLVRAGLIGGMYTSFKVSPNMKGGVKEKKILFRLIDANHFSMGEYEADPIPEGDEMGLKEQGIITYRNNEYRAYWLAQGHIPANVKDSWDFTVETGEKAWEATKNTASSIRDKLGNWWRNRK